MNITTKIIAGLALSFSLAACGGSDGSGVDGSKQLGQLSGDERTDLCEFVIDAQGGAGSMHMCGEFTLTVQTVAECADDLALLTGCTATVAQAEDCAEVEPCDSLTSSACAAVFACQSE
jgi:hypothetical protein